MRNWTVADAVATINAGTDVEGIKEITTHFPIFALAAARGDLATVAAMMPEKMTLRRLNQDAVEAEADDEDTEEEAPKAKATAKAAKSESAEDDGDYSSMTKDQLIALCVEKGLKVAKHQKPKQYYIDALNNAEDGDEEEAPKAKAKAGKANSKSKKAAEDDDEEEDEYTGKSAKELFNMCKDRGIKVQPRQASRVYIEALKAADAEAEGEDGEDDGWGDDEAEETPKAKGSSKGSKKAAAKKDDEDDEDWDI